VVASNTKPVVIFKHSTIRSISRMALKNFEREFDLQEEITPYFLDLLNHRDISNAIASKFEVVHQSPQIVLIKEGKAIYNASHENIDATVLSQKV
jgi:bacillithiol system protein YtxJ